MGPETVYSLVLVFINRGESSAREVDTFELHLSFKCPEETGNNPTIVLGSYTRVAQLY
jgi:hypothetical protein